MNKRRLLIKFLFTVFIFTMLIPRIAEGFDFEMDNPHVRITIPGLPEIKMGPHPLQGQKPYLCYMGYDGHYVMSIMVPTVDKGMTSKEFASSRTSSYVSQWGLSKSQYTVYKLNDNTFLLEYSLEVEGVKRIDVNLMSAYNGTYGIDVHISKTIDSDKEKSEFHGIFNGAIISELK